MKFKHKYLKPIKITKVKYSNRHCHSIDRSEELKQSRYAIRQAEWIAIVAAIAAFISAYFSYEQVLESRLNMIRSEEISAVNSVSRIASKVCGVYAPSDSLSYWDYANNEFLKDVENDQETKLHALSALKKMLDNMKGLASDAYIFQSESEKARILIFGRFTSDDAMQHFANFMVDSGKELVENVERIKVENLKNPIGDVNAIRMFSKLIGNTYWKCIEKRNDIYSLFDMILPPRSSINAIATRP